MTRGKAGNVVAIPPHTLAVEAGATQGWHCYIGEWGDVISLDHFGASASALVFMRKFGFTAKNVYARTLSLLAQNNA